ncbi:unnamed protein product [Cylindrotheca closterium]|uniref:Methyltransferase type 11 domain-containing protein n=1 Tax=Cylindrotheca closterium TaxID=2856 RepID=A0AAD2FQZ6_9STRA|nr:unnamed protein product [Cylindrotheca closterium]
MTDRLLSSPFSLIRCYAGVFFLFSSVHGFSSFHVPLGPRCPLDMTLSAAALSTKSTLSSSSSSSCSSNWDETGKCKFGKKAYWDSVYKGDGDNGADDIPSETYSWYCGFDELKPFWNMLMEPLLLSLTTTSSSSSSTDDDDEEKQVRRRKKSDTQVLVAGIGNDLAPVELYDDGWTNMVAFDYSQAGVDRAKELFGTSRSKVALLQADARQLPLEDGAVDVVFDKGTLDAIYITGEQEFQDSVKELTRVTGKDGVFVCVSAVIPPETLLEAFLDNNRISSSSEEDSCCCWDTILDGGLAFAPDGEATIDLGAQLYAFRRREASRSHSGSQSVQIGTT